MTEELRRLKRLRNSADNLGDQLDRSSNVPLDQYVSVTDIQGLRDTFGIDPESVTADDLSRIIMVREALYTIVEQTNDMEEHSEHSIKQLLHALNQVYVDAQAYLKSKPALVQAANTALEAQAKTPPVPISPVGIIGQSVINVSTEVINNVFHTEKQIHINILNGVSVDVLRNLRVQIRRLSASAFVVNVKVNAQVLFEGTVQFLTATADRVLTDLRAMAETLKESLGSAEAIVKSLDSVIKSGTKFVRIVGSLIQDALRDDTSYTEVKLTLRNAGKSRVVTCGTPLADGTVALCGRNGSIYIVTPAAQATAHLTGFSGHIHAVTALPDGRLALGTSDGVIAWSPKHRGVASSSPSTGRRSSRSLHSGTMLTTRLSPARQWPRSVVGGFPVAAQNTSRPMRNPSQLSLGRPRSAWGASIISSRWRTTSSWRATTMSSYWGRTCSWNATSPSISE